MRGSRKHRPDTSATDASWGMRRRRRSTPLASLLGSRRDQQVWTVRCRDERGRRARLLISLTENGIMITATTPEPWRLTLLEVDRLRGVLRDVLLTLGDGAEPIGPGRRIAARRIVIRERPGGRGSRPELAPPTGQPHQQPDSPMEQVAASQVPVNATQLGRS
ncbi:MAG: hypothetical protein ACRDTF_10525 [Pseudonocardiaceae bacterium]